MKTISFLMLLVCLLVCSANSCRKDYDGTWDGKLTIVNNTNDTILSFLQFNYPDTLLIDENAPELNNLIVPPKSSRKHYSSISWEDRIARLNSYETIMIFINSYDTLRKYSWNHIKTEYNILRRYDLHVDSLEKLGWTIMFTQ